MPASACKSFRTPQVSDKPRGLQSDIDEILATKRAWEAGTLTAEEVDLELKRIREKYPQPPLTKKSKEWATQVVMRYIEEKERNQID